MMEISSIIRTKRIYQEKVERLERELAGAKETLANLEASIEHHSSDTGEKPKRTPIAYRFYRPKQGTKFDSV